MRGALWAGLAFVVIVLATGVVSHVLERADWDERWIERTGLALSHVHEGTSRAVVDVRYDDHTGTPREAALPLFRFQGRDALDDLVTLRAGDRVPVLVPRAGGQPYVAEHLGVDVGAWLWAALAFGALNAGAVALADRVDVLIRARGEPRLSV